MPADNKNEYGISPEEATAFDSGIVHSASFDRKKVLLFLSLAFAIIICGGLLLNINKKKAPSDDANNNRAAHVPQDFLKNELDKSARNGEQNTAAGGVYQADDGQPLPEVTVAPYSAQNTNYSGTPSPNAPPQQQPQGGGYSGGGGSTGSGGGGGGGAGRNTANYSALSPPVEGSLFGGRAQNAAAPTGTYAEKYPYATMPPQGQQAAMPYGALSQSLPQGSYPAQNDLWTNQNAQADKNGFSNSATGGALNSGYFLGENSLWLGTIVQAVLETAINTDLPGNIIARVTHNVYDSLTGQKLLIPQGSLLVARYNSSISYAQNRVQIVWDTLVRPDGFYIELEGMPAVDKAGMSGQEALYHENWFEYFKAAGIITMFSIASSKMTAETEKYTTTDTRQGIVAGNAEFVNQIGSNIVSKAMNIQPTLTVENATLINIMLNKTLYLPEVKQ